MRSLLAVFLAAILAACSGAGPSKMGSVGDTRRAAPSAAYEFQPSEPVPPPVAKAPAASVLSAPYVVDVYPRKKVVQKAPKAGWETSAARKVGETHYTFFIDHVTVGGGSSAKGAKAGDSADGEGAPTSNEYKLEARLPQGMTTSLTSAPPVENRVDVFTPEFKAMVGGFGLAVATLVFGFAAGGFAVWLYLSSRQPKRT